MSSATTDENSRKRVANYELHTQLSELNSNVLHLSERFEEYCDRAAKRHDDHEGRIRGLEKSVTRMRERQGILTAAQSTLTLFASVVAGWFGTRQ